MEKSTLTIEIKQEVSVFLVWIVAGIMLVLIAFFLRPHRTNYGSSYIPAALRPSFTSSPSCSISCVNLYRS